MLFKERSHKLAVDHQLLLGQQLQADVQTKQANVRLCLDSSNPEDAVIVSEANNEEPSAEMLDFPGVEDGIRGMQFIDTVVSAGYNDEVKWVKFGEMIE